MPVSRVEIVDRGPLAAGRSFGASGPYEYLTGVLHFASDPGHPGNKAICDLNLAPTNREGLVEHRAQFHLLKPVGPKPRGRVLVDSINRGNITALATFNSVARRTDANPDVDPGNGFLFRHGYSVLCIGVQWDPPESPERMRAWYPEALENGQRVRGQNFVQWWPNKRTPHQLLSDSGHKPYPTADINDPSAVLIVRDHQDGEPIVIARSRWRFAKAGKDSTEPNADYVWLEGGFDAGKVYELTYTALGAPVVGLAFLAYRDAATFLKHGSAAEANPLAGAIDYAYGYGQSMNGRWLREYLYWGLNRDESGRIAFDGMLANTASSRRGEFNIRFGQPSTNILRAPGNTYPFVRSDARAISRRQPRSRRPLPRGRVDAQSDRHEFGNGILVERRFAGTHHGERRAGSRAAGRRSHLLHGRCAARPRRAPAIESQSRRVPCEAAVEHPRLSASHARVAHGARRVGTRRHRSSGEPRAEG